METFLETDLITLTRMRLSIFPWKYYFWSLYFRNIIIMQSSRGRITACRHIYILCIAPPTRENFRVLVHILQYTILYIKTNVTSDQTNVIWRAHFPGQNTFKPWIQFPGRISIFHFLSSPFWVGKSGVENTIYYYIREKPPPPPPPSLG